MTPFQQGIVVDLALWALAVAALGSAARDIVHEFKRRRELRYVRNARH